MKEILRLVDISKRFPGNQALSTVSVTFYENEIHGIVGKNGAGKSTLMNIVMGIIDADEGEICLLYTSPSPRDRQKSRMPSSA